MKYLFESGNYAGGKVSCRIHNVYGDSHSFGNRGLLDNYRMGKRLAAIQQANEGIVQENREYQKQIDLLKNHLGYIEMLARNELGMGRKGDVVYRFPK
jgi:cell division protein FtsB